jgi:hypothetical protein
MKLTQLVRDCIIYIKGQDSNPIIYLSILIVEFLRAIRQKQKQKYQFTFLILHIAIYEHACDWTIAQAYANRHQIIVIYIIF